MRRRTPALLAITALASMLLLPVVTNSTTAADYSWHDTRGPGNGDAYALECGTHDTHDYIYRGTATRGIWRYDIDAPGWTDISIPGIRNVPSLYNDTGSNILYAGTAGSGVWRCENPWDSPPTWASTGGGLGTYYVYCLAFSAGTLYAGTDGHGVWRCTNPGDTSPAWESFGVGIESLTVKSLAVLTGRLYAGVSADTNKNVWSCDYATPPYTWADTLGPAAASGVGSMCCDGMNMLYAGTESNGVYRYDVGATSWANISIGGGNDSVRSLGLNGPSLYAGTGNSTLYRTDDPGVPMPTWNDITGTMTDNGYPSLLFIGTDLYAGTYKSGVWYTGNPGATPPTWDGLGGGVSNDEICSLAYSGGTVYAGTVSRGVWRCSNPFDASPTWTDIGGGLSGYTVHSLLYMGGYLYAGTAGQGVWRCADPLVAVPTWVATAGAIDTYEVHSLASYGTTLYAGTEGHGAYSCSSPTSGPPVTWSILPGGIETYDVLSLCHTGTGLYAGTEGHGLYRYVSPSWLKVGVTGGSGGDIHSLVYANGAMYANAGGGGVWRSVNPGDASPMWTFTNGGTKDYAVYSLAFADSTLYAGTVSHGVWYSFYPDATPPVSWIETGGGVSPLRVDSLAYTGQSRMFAGTYGCGVWWSDVPPLPQPPPPVITSISPVSGCEGTEVTINGTDFGATKGTTSLVTFNTAYGRDYNSWTDTQIRVLVPSGATSGFVKVTTPSGTSNGVAFEVTPTEQATKPVIDSISPESGPPGTYVTITGSNFGSTREGSLRSESSSYVAFNGVAAAEYPLWSENKIIAVVPNGATPGPVTVMTAAGSSAVTKTFKVTASTFYFAEGTCRPNFDPYICIQNPNSVESSAKVTYMLGTGQTQEQAVTIPSNSRFTISVKGLLGEGDDAAHDFSAKVESVNNTQIICERSMYFNYQGYTSLNWTGGHDVVGATCAARTFYFAEGTCRPNFDSYICIQNPGLSMASVHITYMLGDGTTRGQDITVPARSRFTVVVKDVLGEADDATHDFSAKVESVGSAEIICERPMYFNYQGFSRLNWTGGHDVVGALATGKTFYFAEGTCRPGFDPYICVQNPGELEAKVTITYMLGDGSLKWQDLGVPPRARYTVIVKNALGEANDAAHDFSAKVETTNETEIICERPMYFNYNGVWTGGHDVVGAPAPAQKLFFAEGTCRPGFDPYLCVQNPGGAEASVQITYMLGSGATRSQNLQVPASSRRTVAVKDTLGVANDIAHDFSARVECTNDQKIIVERPMYFNYQGKWTGGHDVVGYTSPGQ